MKKRPIAWLASLTGALVLQCAPLANAQEESFEVNGEVAEVDLINRTLSVDGVSLKVPDGLQAAVDGVRVPFFSVVRDGATVMVSGEYGGRGEAIIRSAVVDDLPLGIAAPKAPGE